MFDWVVYLPISGTEVNGFALILLGFTVGVIGGFFGVGGAFMVTPALNVFGFPMAYAIGTDMAHIAGKSIVATFKHRKFGNVDMKLALLMIIGTVIGIELGATLILWLEKIGRIGPIVRVTYMCLLFGLGLFMLYEYMTGLRRVSSQTATEKPTDAGQSKLALWMQSRQWRPIVHLKVSGFHISVWVIIGMGLVTGFLAGFLGVGGGFIRMPALMYIIGAPTKVAVGTDLFEVMVTGAYGAFSYAIKGRVELLAAMIMVIGAAVGAQLGATATLYARGTIIRLYFSLTMLAGGLSVVFKHFSESQKDIYRGALNDWARATSGLTDKVELGLWLQENKSAVKAWFATQPEPLQQALAADKMWATYSGVLMLGSACILSAVIIFWLVRGILRERAEAAAAPAAADSAPTAFSASLPAATADGNTALAATQGGLTIATRCTPTDLPAVRMGAQIAAGLKKPATLLVCREPGMSETALQDSRQVLENAGLPPHVVFATGKPGEEILRISAESRLLVIGSRPLTTLDPTWHLGDNATRIVRHMTTSTLVVRGREQVRRILLSTDLPASGPTLQMTQDIALATGASVEVLYTKPLATMYVASSTKDTHNLTEDAQRLGVPAEQLAQLESVRDGLTRGGVAQVAIKLRQGIVEEEIIKESIEGDFDIIVIREGYLRTPFGLLLGRLSTNVATRSPQASVLIVKR
ncbi:TSUP family transporter [Ideonella sp. DXS29W]|uniref:Probable membrane transporter protein n=1 Tax=Ideonella lacteola TaxID=2984193 RepID=A0ABU9BV83_9BURK